MPPPPLPPKQPPTLFTPQRLRTPYRRYQMGAGQSLLLFIYFESIIFYIFLSFRVRCMLKYYTFSIQILAGRESLEEKEIRKSRQ